MKGEKTPCSNKMAGRRMLMSCSDEQNMVLCSSPEPIHQSEMGAGTFPQAWRCQRLWVPPELCSRVTCVRQGVWRDKSGLCPGSQKTFCSVEVGNNGEKKISNFQCVVVIVVPELSVKGCARQEDLRMLRCLGVDVKSQRKVEQWNFGGRGAAQLERGWTWHREGLAQTAVSLPRVLSEEDLSCWDGGEKTTWRLETGCHSLSAGSQGSYTGRQWVRARGICVIF